MRELLLSITILAMITSCGSKSEDGAPVGNTENIELREDKTLSAVEVACHVFSEDHNENASSFQDAFPSLHQDCQNEVEINETTSEAVMESYKMAFEIFTSFDGEAHKSCVPLMKRVMKRFYQIKRRSLRPTNDKREKQQVLSKSDLQNLMRGLIARSCLVDFDSFSYLYNDEEKTFEFDSNHIRNGSFEIIKDLNSNQFIELGRQWALFPNKKVPAWKVKPVVVREDVTCGLLEVQGDGVTTTSPEGQHYVELDSHCLNSNGNQVGGDARVVISQQFFVKRPGSYRLTMKAQKRNGSHGDLQVATYQRGRDKEFLSQALSNQAEWNDVCVDVEIVETEKTLKVAIQDGDSTGRTTYGLLLDDVKFEEGSCL
jgi:hypothetical protein